MIFSIYIISLGIEEYDSNELLYLLSTFGLAIIAFSYTASFCFNSN